MSEPPNIEVPGAAGPLRGSVRTPGDKSISHRALLLAARAEGTSVIRGLSRGDDVARTAAAVAAIGAELRQGPRARVASEDELRVLGGAGRLAEPADVLDLGNSGTSMRLLSGYLAPLPWVSVLTGDASLRSRPMGRVTAPLRSMGAHIDGRQGDTLAPLTIRGGALSAIDYELPVPSAQVKGSILLAALGAAGRTRVREKIPTRMHTEELLTLAGGRVTVTPDAGHAPGGHVVEVEASELRPFELAVPSDPSQAAFFVVAACIVPGSEVTCENVYLGAGRVAFLDVLERMGAQIERHYRDSTTGDIVARYGPLHGTDVSGDEVPSLIDEVPALVVAAALAEGTSTYCDVGELRVKESDRIATMERLVSSLGGRVESGADSLTVVGNAGARLRGATTVDTAGDHRVAMAAAVAALTCDEAIRIDDWSCVATSYPGFLSDLRALGAVPR